MLENAEFGPVGIIYDATSGRGNPALAGFVSSSHCFDIDVSICSEDMCGSACSAADHRSNYS